MANGECQHGIRCMVIEFKDKYDLSSQSLHFSQAQKTTIEYSAFEQPIAAQRMESK